MPTMTSAAARAAAPAKPQAPDPQVRDRDVADLHLSRASATAPIRAPMPAPMRTAMPALVPVPGPGTATPPVTVLLGQMNGARFLEAQLSSIAAQTGCRPRLIVSDDGSADHGPMLVRAFSARHPEVEVTTLAGPQRGFAQNFLHLLRAAGPDVPYVALCDQDDYWLPGRLARALRRIEQVPADIPALYGSRTLICNADLTPRTPSGLHARPPSFRNALVQSIAGGNTMVLNRAALDLVQAASTEATEIVAHDWWIYQIVAGAGGRVIYDPEPGVLYRQHDHNIVGANNSFRSSLIRLGAVLGGRFRQWNGVNVAALAASAHRFTPENAALLRDFTTLREAPLWRRLRLLRRSGLYRQTVAGDAALWIATLLRRI